MKYYMLDEARNIVTTEDANEWGAFFEDWRRRIVAQSLFEDARVAISTVFIGIDYNWSGQGPPLLFETMVFGGPLDSEQDRYATWAEAEAGHRAWVLMAAVHGVEGHVLAAEIRRLTGGADVSPAE